jgi:REP element-mobilizing transposase RayT
MARQIRHNVEGGWYHITTRGMGRREIFLEDRDREHFVELLSGLVERYGIVLHAYVLMENHYHLLIETPHANASRALQWLNVSYAAWFNAKHRRTGPVFQQRYKGIPVDGEGSWALACSVYVHLNPVRVQSLGLGKEDRAREKAGFLPKEPSRAQVAARLAKLRGHRWSSYPAYAGYSAKPGWLTCEGLWRRVGTGKGKEDGKADYRRYLEDCLRQGVEEGAFARITSAVAVGGAAFVERLRRKVPPSARSDTNARAWRRLLPFGEVVKAVETVKGEEWASFADRKGDCGRDLALYVARMNCGLSIPELAAFAGIAPSAASKALQRMKKRLPGDRKLKAMFRKVSAEIGVREK